MLSYIYINKQSIKPRTPVIKLDINLKVQLSLFTSTNQSTSILYSTIVNQVALIKHTNFIQDKKES